MSSRLQSRPTRFLGHEAQGPRPKPIFSVAHWVYPRLKHNAESTLESEHYAECGAGGVEGRRIQQAPESYPSNSINTFELDIVPDSPHAILRRTSFTATRDFRRGRRDDRPDSSFPMVFAPGLVPSIDHHITRSLTCWAPYFVVIISCLSQSSINSSTTDF